MAAVGDTRRGIEANMIGEKRGSGSGGGQKLGMEGSWGGVLKLQSYIASNTIVGQKTHNLQPKWRIALCNPPASTGKLSGNATMVS